MDRLNLSSHPFTNHRLFWIGILVVVMVCMFAVWSMAQQKSLDLGEIDRINAGLKSRQLLIDKIKEAEEERKKRDVPIFLTPQDAVQLAAARQIISRRVFSWDRMTSDLEKNVPSKSRIVGIKIANIKFGPEGPIAAIEVTALGTKASELTEMMTSLNKTDGLFTVGDVTQAQATDTGQVPFSLKVQYEPRKSQEK